MKPLEIASLAALDELEARRAQATEHPEEHWHPYVLELNASFPSIVARITALHDVLSFYLCEQDAPIDERGHCGYCSRLSCAVGRQLMQE